jgi:hypothetical protein
METEEKTYPEWEYVRVSSKCSFHEWATTGEWRKTHNGKKIAIVAEQRYAVPGGWLYQVRDDWGDEGFHPPVYVPSPYAPHVIAENERAAKLAILSHCQPPPPADDRPPMTDDALRAWLTATYGEPDFNDGITMIWPGVFRRPGNDDPSAVTMETLYGVKSWHFNDGQQWVHAHIAGPALWAAHRYGNP